MPNGASDPHAILACVPVDTDKDTGKSNKPRDNQYTDGEDIIYEFTNGEERE